MLLLSQGAGHTRISPDKLEAERLGGISLRQRKLAEITEMIHLTQEIHFELQDPPNCKREMLNDVVSENNIRILIGDLILAMVWRALAELRSPNTMEAMSTVIANSVEGHFFDALSEKGKYLHSILAKRQFLKVASLQANACRASLDLAGHGIVAQSKAFSFGENVAMAIRTYEEILPFYRQNFAENESARKCEVMCTPVLIHLRETARSMDQFRFSDGSIDYDKLFSSVSRSNAIHKAKTLIKFHCDQASEALGYFRQSESIEILARMVNILRDASSQDQIKSNQIKSDQIRSNQIKSAEPTFSAMAQFIG